MPTLVFVMTQLEWYALDKNSLENTLPIDDGVVKFDHSDYQVTPALDNKTIEQINAVRCQLYKLNLIGEYPEEKVGFGNISQRINFQHLKKK